jgi:hypothetical protein
MLLPTRMVSDPVYDFEELDGAEGPDSQVRTLPQGARMHLVTVRVCDALANGWVTVMLLAGEVLFEGDMAGASIEVRVPVPFDATQIKLLVEAGSKYRHALVDLGPEGVTEYAFA